MEAPKTISFEALLASSTKRVLSGRAEDYPTYKQLLPLKNLGFELSELIRKAKETTDSTETRNLVLDILDFAQTRVSETIEAAYSRRREIESLKSGSPIEIKRSNANGNQ